MLAREGAEADIKIESRCLRLDADCIRHILAHGGELEPQSRMEAQRWLVHRSGLHLVSEAEGERSGGSLKGKAFLLQADFLNNSEATYKIADAIAKSEDESITIELRSFLLEEWTEGAFTKGRSLGEAHHLNVMRALKRGSSPLHLLELPLQLQVTVAYLPLYKECLASTGVVLSQWLRGQLVEAALRLNHDGGEESLKKLSKQELLAVLESRFPGFVLKASSEGNEYSAQKADLFLEEDDDDGGDPGPSVRCQLDQALIQYYGYVLLED